MPVQTTDGGPISFSSDVQTWVIVPGVIVTGIPNSNNSNAVIDAGFIDATLINHGSILSDNAGVRFEGSNGNIVNQPGALIAAPAAIVLDGVSATVTNNGTVTGRTGILMFADSTSAVVNNHGEIYGVANGIEIIPLTGSFVINNTGLIHSDGIGISATHTLVIDNAVGGVIKGAVAAIADFLSTVSLNNRGSIIGDVNLNGSGNNHEVVNSGKIDGEVFFGAGNDRYDGRGGTATAVFGGDGNDRFFGGDKDDNLHGGDGSDMLRGGRGRDVLSGDGDSDLFDFNSIKDSLKGSQRDKIMDFTRGEDRIDLNGIDAKTGVEGDQTFKFIGRQDFHERKGELRYEDKGSTVIVQGDVNGDGKADFEIWVNVGALAKGDFIL